MQTVKKWWAERSDEIFAYQTPKIVLVRDRYLGLAHYFLLVCIFVYIIGIVLIYEKGYLNLDDPTSTFRATIREPSADSPTYCGYVPQQVPKDQLRYCSENPACVGDCRDCRYADWRYVLYPEFGGATMFLTTRVTTTDQYIQCDALMNNTCFEPYADAGPSATAYIANVEEFTLGLFHSVRAKKFFDEAVAAGTWDFDGDPYKQLDVAGSNQYMSGKLVDSRNKQLCTFERDENDVFPIRTLLQAAELDLDDPTDAAGANGTSRYEGAVITLSVDYDNTNSRDYIIGYTYRAIRVPGVDYKIEEIVYTGGGNRTVNNRHGILFIFSESGAIGRPDFQVALVQLVSALALTATAALVVDFVALKLLPMREKYNDYKFQHTPNFSELRTDSPLFSFGSSKKKSGGNGGGVSDLGGKDDDNVNVNLAPATRPEKARLLDN